MSRVLTLESFRSVPPPPAPSFDADDLEAAAAEGRAQGRREAADEAATDLRRAIAGLAAALEGDRARATALNQRWRDQLIAIAEAIVRTLAGPLRADALAAQVMQALLAEVDAGRTVPAKIRCEPAAVSGLRVLMAAQGIADVEIEAAGTGARFDAGDCTIRIEPDRVETMLTEIIAGIGAMDEDEG